MKTSLFVMLIGILAIASCVAPTPLVSPQQSPVSPLNPPTASSNSTIGPNFKLRPFAPGATEVSGQGPVGFTLVIIDVTYGAKELGRGQTDSQGNFQIKTTQPLEAGHLIGLTVDLLAEQTNDQNLNNQLFEIRGPGYRFVPNLVTVFDSYEAK